METRAGIRVVRWARRFARPALFALAAGAGLAGCHEHLCPPPVVPPSPPPIQCHPLPCAGEGKPLVVPGDPPAPADKPQLIDLPTALQLADRQNPEIAVARERINQALAVQQQAEVLWIPDLAFGSGWNRHDGQIQRFNGEVRTASRSSLFVGVGPQLWLTPGEAYFAPLATRQLTAARQAGAAALTNERLLDVSLAYADLLQAYAELLINDETLRNAGTLLDITATFEKAGKGAAADTARARTEVRDRERQRIEIDARIGVASARLVELLYLPPEFPLHPAEPAMVPVALVPEKAPLPELIAQALAYRPELEENRALTLAALQRWRAAKVQPWVPNISLSYDAGGFGGGPNSFFGEFSGRQDLDVSLQWTLDNFGLGNAARTREAHSRYSQAALQQNALGARVAREVVSAFRVAYARRRALTAAQQAVEAARESYQLNEQRVRRAPEQGRPIELLQAVQALARARLDYLVTVADYNRAQFRLYTAMGNPPLCALDAAAQVSVQEPTVPELPKTTEEEKK
jgi:outer membrane protein TolC